MPEKSNEMKKKLLIYGHYYVPDVASTGQILKELAEGLMDTFDITIICVVPSYNGIVDNKYKEKRYYKENIAGVKVLRVRVPEFTKTNKRSRIKNIMAYFFGAIVATYKIGHQDCIFSISQPPVLGGLLGIWGKWKKKAKFIYNIQDLNPEQIQAVGYSKNNMILRIMLCLDKISCSKSDLIITVGEDIVETIQKRFLGKTVPKTLMINNWVNEEKIYPLPPFDEKVQAFKNKYGLKNKFVIMYSGNIGLYYDLENLIKIIEKFKKTRTKSGKEVIFAFVGDGVMLDYLKTYVDQHLMKNVVFIPYQHQDGIIYSLNAGDVQWCVSAKGIKGVSCPSKYYGIAAVGKPVLGVLEVGSEIRNIVEKTKSGLVCEPGEYKRVESNIQWFIDHDDSSKLKDMGNRGYEYLVSYLTKSMSIEKYKRAIKEVIEG